MPTQRLTLLPSIPATTRRPNQRHDWWLRVLFALVVFNVLVELHTLWATHTFLGGYWLVRHRMGTLLRLDGYGSSTYDWQEQVPYMLDAPECFQLTPVVELIAGTLPDPDPSHYRHSTLTLQDSHHGADHNPTQNPGMQHGAALAALARMMLSQQLTEESAAAIGAMLRGNITNEVQPLLRTGACTIDLCNQIFRIPKVALMFLSKGELPHEALWNKWFEAVEGRLPYDQAAASVCVANSTQLADALLDAMRQVCLPGHQQGSPLLRQHLFSVYIHAPPSFSGFHNQSIFANHLLAGRIQARWGSFELVVATKLLLRQALSEPSNHHFVLLSESDIPLYPPALVYQQIISEPLSRIDACGSEDTSSWRYREVMARAGIPYRNWRKSWQWFMLTRQHAKLVVDDKKVHKAFERHCNPTDEDLSREGGFDCYSDEHYIPTLLSVMGKENETSCQRTITNVDWRAHGAHPRTYKAQEVNPSRIRLLRRPHKRCQYVTAMRSAAQSLFLISDIVAQGSHTLPGLCTDPARSDRHYSAPLGPQCPLFARKFPADTKDAVLRLYSDCGSKLNILSEVGCKGVEGCGGLFGSVLRMRKGRQHESGC